MESTKPANEVLESSVWASLDNADRLADDAQYLFDWERYPSSFALAVLAQEEAAKAFLLHLAASGSVPWNDEIRRVLRDHATKQLLMLVMDFLEPDEERFGGFREMLEARSKSNYQVPAHVTDALNIIRHEKIPKQGEWAWREESDKPCDDLARRVADGKLDKQKQGAIYVKVAKDGRVAQTPSSITKEVAAAELERMKRVGGLLFRYEGKLTAPRSVEYEKISGMFRVLFGLSTIEEYNQNWWAR